MTTSAALTADQASSGGGRSLCPTWCVTGHRAELGEEDWLHTSEPIPLTEGVRATLVMSINPSTGEPDGPYLMVGTTEYTLTEATTLTRALTALVGLTEDERNPEITP